MSDIAFHHRKAKSRQRLKKINVPRDGDCLFNSIELILRQILESGNDRLLLNHLHGLGIEKRKPPADNVLRLRQLMVNEGKNNFSCYEKYLLQKKKEEFKKNMHEFLQPGIYAGDFGDLMLPAIINVLKIPGEVVMSDGTATQKVWPERDALSSSTVLHMHLDCSGSGHYSAFVQKTTTTKDQNGIKPAAIISCSCGKNKKSLSQRCCSNEGMKYKTRCPCFNNEQGCSPSCRCKGCSNPNGKKEKKRKAISNLENQKKKKRRCDKLNMYMGQAHVYDSTVTSNGENGRVLEKNKWACHSHSSPRQNKEHTLGNGDTSGSLIVISESEWNKYSSNDINMDKVVIKEYQMHMPVIPEEKSVEFFSNDGELHENDSKSEMKNIPADPQLYNNCLEESLPATPTPVPTPSLPPLLPQLQLPPPPTENDMITTTKLQNSIKPAAFTSCSCGKNLKSSSRKCCIIEGMKYKTRCPCFNNEQGCSPSCRCKGCSNPNGKKEKTRPC